MNNGTRSLSLMYQEGKNAHRKKTLTVPFMHYTLYSDSVSIHEWSELRSNISRNVPNLHIANVFDLDGVPLGGRMVSILRVSIARVVSRIVFIVWLSDQTYLFTRSDHSVVVAYSDYLRIQNTI